MTEWETVTMLLYEDGWIVCEDQWGELYAADGEERFFEPGEVLEKTCVRPLWTLPPKEEARLRMRAEEIPADCRERLRGGSVIPHG